MTLLVIKPRIILIAFVDVNNILFELLGVLCPEVPLQILAQLLRGHLQIFLVTLKYLIIVIVVDMDLFSHLKDRCLDVVLLQVEGECVSAT